MIIQTKTEEGIGKYVKPISKLDLNDYLVLTINT